MKAFRRGIQRSGGLPPALGWILAGLAVAVNGAGLIGVAPACSPTAGQEQAGSPLEIENLASSEREIVFRLRNHSARRIQFAVGDRHFEILEGGVGTFSMPAEGEAPFQIYDLKLESPGLPTLSHPVFVYRPNAPAEWVTRQAGDYTIQIAQDGAGIRWVRGGRAVALAAPLIQRGRVAPKLRLLDQETSLRFRGDGIGLSVTITGDDVAVAIDSQESCEGPVLRTLGPLEQGLFAGLEYLGKGEASSSRLDVDTPDHWRFAPAVSKVTMPLMACRTGDDTVAITWKDMRLQPTFAAPNFVDGSRGQRMALRGQKIEATLRVVSTAFEESIRWAIQNHGLPPPPRVPRGPDEQWALCRQALDGPLKGKDGWGPCAEANWARRPYADCASTVFRLTGRVPELPRLVPGGAHLPNDVVYFVTGRADEWLRFRRRQATDLLRQQKPDGSYHYAGKYQRGHFEDTASGFCAERAAVLLEFARLTGDRGALAAGLETLNYMRRFRTPRGAQTWELSLHTPDILAAAHLVHAYVRGYELSGNKAYLDLARKWALSGAPFVYLWGDRAVMVYGTVPVLGATNWTAPNWIGLPVQWCGLVYADALLLLAPHDRSLDWRRLAQGILIAGEQMQQPGGPLIGCLPDSFELATQARRGPFINPCALVSLRLALDGRLAGLAVADSAGHRVVAPYAVCLQDEQIHIRAPKGSRYQILIDGERVVSVISKGDDIVNLTGGSTP